MTLDPSSTLGRVASLPGRRGRHRSGVCGDTQPARHACLHAGVLSAIGGGDDSVIDSLLQSGRTAGRRCTAALADKTTIIIQRPRRVPGRRRGRVADADGAGQDAGAGLRDRAVPAWADGTAFACAGVVLLCGDEADRAAVVEAWRTDGAAPARAPSSSTAAAERRSSAAVEHRFAAAPRSRRRARMLPSLQRLIISIAARKVDRVGEPIHSTKITRETS